MPVRKALFSKPAWAAKSPEPFEDDQPASIFQQNVYEDILQEKRRKEERRAAKEKEKGHKSRRTESGSRGTRSDDDRTVKKRRISKTPIEVEEDEEDDDFDERRSGSDSDHASTRSGRSRRQKTPTVQLETDKSASRTTRGTTRAQSNESKTVSPQEARASIITVGSDDEDLVIYDSAPIPLTKTSPSQTKPRAKPKPPPPPESETDSDPEEDEYVKALKRKAREEARAKNVQGAAKGATANPSSHNILSPDPDQTSTSTTTESQVHIYINSILPNCPPIGIIRRPSQTLESVHTYFCETHKLGDLLRSKVFFTWNNQRLFKSTTTKSILDQIKRKHGGIDKSEGKIVLEAVTEEILEYRLQKKEEARRRAEAGEDNEDATGDNENNEINHGVLPTDAAGVLVTSNGDGNQPAPTAGVIIKLNSATPDLPSMQLRVRSHTTIDKIVRGYKKRMEVDMAKPVYLVFEGDRLEVDRTVEEVGFEDGDCVDVRCK